MNSANLAVLSRTLSSSDKVLHAHSLEIIHADIQSQIETLVESFIARTVSQSDYLAAYRVLVKRNAHTLETFRNLTGYQMPNS